MTVATNILFTHLKRLCDPQRALDIILGDLGEKPKTYLIPDCLDMDGLVALIEDSNEISLCKYSDERKQVCVIRKE